MSQSIAAYTLRECIIACASFASGEVHFYTDFVELYAADHYGHNSSPLQLEYVDFIQFKASRESGTLRLSIPYACITNWAEVNQCASQLQPDMAEAPVAVAAGAKAAGSGQHAHQGRAYPRPAMQGTAPGEAATHVLHESAPCYVLLRLLPEDINHFFDAVADSLATHFRASRSMSRLSVAAAPLRLSAPPCVLPYTRSVPSEATQEPVDDDGDVTSDGAEQAAVDSRASSMGSHITARMVWHHARREESAAPAGEDGTAQTLLGDAQRGCIDDNDICHGKDDQGHDYAEADEDTQHASTPVSASSKSADQRVAPLPLEKPRQAPSASLSDQLATLARDVLDPLHLRSTGPGLVEADEANPYSPEASARRKEKGGGTHARHQRLPSPPPLLLRRGRRPVDLDGVPRTATQAGTNATLIVTRCAAEAPAQGPRGPRRYRARPADPAAARDITDEIMASFVPQRCGLRAPTMSRARRQSARGNSTRAKPSHSRGLRAASLSSLSSVPLVVRGAPHRDHVLVQQESDDSAVAIQKPSGVRTGQARSARGAPREPAKAMPARSMLEKMTATAAALRERQSPQPIAGAARQCRRRAQLCASQEPENEMHRATAVAVTEHCLRPEPRSAASREAAVVATNASVAAAPLDALPDDPDAVPADANASRYSQDELRGRALTILMEDEPAAAVNTPLSLVSPRSKGGDAQQKEHREGALVDKRDEDEDGDDDDGTLLGDFLCVPPPPPPPRATAANNAPAEGPSLSAEGMATPQSARSRARTKRPRSRSQRMRHGDDGGEDGSAAVVHRDSVSSHAEEAARPSTASPASSPLSPARCSPQVPPCEMARVATSARTARPSSRPSMDARHALMAAPSCTPHERLRRNTGLHASEKPARGAFKAQAASTHTRVRVLDAACYYRSTSRVQRERVRPDAGAPLEAVGDRPSTTPGPTVPVMKTPVVPSAVPAAGSAAARLSLDAHSDALRSHIHSLRRALQLAYRHARDVDHLLAHTTGSASRVGDAAHDTR